MKKYSIYSLFFLLVITACKNQPASKNKNSSSVGNSLKEADQINFDAAFYEGNKQMVLGNHHDAILQFKKCILANPKSDVAHYLLAKEYNATQQFNLSLPAAQQAVKINNKNIWYLLLVADDLTHTDKNFEAAKILEHIADQFLSNESYYFNAAESYIVSKKYNEALHCLDKLEKVSGVNEEISFKKEDLFLKLSKKDQAIAELQKLIFAFPTRTRYKVALAEVYFGFKEDAKANELLEQILFINPTMPEAHFLLANIYRRKGEHEKSFQELKIVFTNPDADLKEKLEILSSFIPLLEHRATVLTQALELGGLLVVAHPEDDASRMLYADLLYRADRYLEAKQFYLKALNNNKANFNLYQNLILCEDQLKQYTDAQKHAEEALEAFPSQAVFYYYKAHFAYLLKDYTTAMETAKNGSDIGSDKTQLLIQLLTILGDAANELKYFKSSDDAFDKILTFDPNNLEVLNNYSYYLSLRKERLDKAETMSKKTLDIDPNNASYLDTYGWVLYQQKKYTEAKLFIENALLKEPNNGVLNEHLGDVYYQLKEIEKAMEYWKKAVGNGNSSSSLSLKINSKKLID